MYGRILVALDGSQISQRGLREAIGLAESLGAQLRLMHVVTNVSWSSHTLPTEEGEQRAEELRSNGECILHEAMRMARDAGVPADQCLIEALGRRAGECIVAEARSWPAELIVCGAHGRRSVGQLSGGDAQYVMRNSPVPVLMVSSV